MKSAVVKIADVVAPFAVTALISGVIISGCGPELSLNVEEVTIVSRDDDLLAVLVVLKNDGGPGSLEYCIEAVWYDGSSFVGHSAQECHTAELEPEELMEHTLVSLDPIVTATMVDVSLVLIDGTKWETVSLP